MPETDDRVELTDLDVIARYSLAVRAATADRSELIAALRSDLDWLEGGRRRHASRRDPAPAPAAPTPAAEPAKPSPRKAVPARKGVPARKAVPARAATTTKQSAKKQSAKKQPAKKQPAKKQPAKKQLARRQPASKPAKRGTRRR